jgi:hypothetical protein
LITVLAPVAILAIWGSSYVWSCVLVLSAPGKPLEFKYQSKSGPLTLRAESYAIDWDHKAGFIEGFHIYGPDGADLASARRIDAVGLQFPNPTAIRVRARDVRAKLTRLESGRFDIQDYLPERQGPPSDIPFSVTVNRADVTLIDKAGKDGFRQLAIARDIEVRGFGEKWVADAALELPGTGSLRAELQSLPNEGFLLRGRTAGIQLAPLLAHFKKTPDIARAPFLKDLQLTSLEAFGPVSVFVPKDKAFQIETRMRAIATNVRYVDYAADKAFFEGVLSGTEARGRLDALYGPTKAKFNGSMIWKSGIEVGGALAVDSPSSAALPPWLRNQIPSEIAFRGGHMDGWLDYRPSSGLRVEGLVHANQASAYGQSFDKPKVNLTAGTEQLRIGIVSGMWAGTPVTGALLVGIRSPSLTGALTANSVNLATVANRFGAKGLSGKAQVSVLLGGTRTHPTAILQATGNGSYKVNGKVLTGRFQAAGNYASDIVKIERLRVGTSAGSARAIGTLSLKSKAITLDVDATNIQLEKLRDDLAGQINASGVVTGTLSNPQFNGEAMALGLKASDQELPFASARITADRNRLIASRLRAVKGTGEAAGDLAINFKSRGLSGSLRADNVLLNEYLGEDALGTVTIPNLTLGGTLDDPRLAGTAYGDNLLIGGIRLDRAEIASTMRGTVANIESLTAKIGAGAVTGSGKYDYKKKTGTLALKGENLSIDRITPPGKGSANVTGLVSGQANATISPSGTIRGRANGQLKDVNLNGTEFGSGTWALGYDGSDVTGDASVGKLDRFFLLENVDYNVKSETIKGQVSILNGSIKDLYTSTRPFFPELSFELRQRLDQTEGDLDTTVAFSGSITNPNLDVQLLDAHNLMLGSQALGSLQASLTKVGTVWDIASVKWTGAADKNGVAGTLLLNKGRIDTNGDINIDGELSNFDLQYVGLIDPSWARLQGYASSSFLASGRTESPTIRASLESTKGSSFTFGGTGESFRMNLYAINISQARYAADGSYTGGIAVNGQFFYRGFSGDVVAHVPLNFPFEIPDGRQISAALTFPNVSLKDIAQYATFLDTERSAGNLSGEIALVGTKSDLGLRGTVLGQADSIALVGIQTTLKAAVASVKLQDNQIVLNFDSTGSDGGTLAANLTTTLPDLGSTLDKIAKSDTEGLTRNPVQGNIVATDFAVRQTPKEKELGTYHAKVSTNLAISGPAITPTIKGRVGISDTNILLPSVFEGAGPSVAMLFDPRFDIPIELDEVARFRTSTADVSLTGGGLLSGSLSHPNFAGTLTLAGGRLNLPTARITLEEGGTLRPSYGVSSSGDTSARVDVNLEGRTTITSVSFGDTVQRYDITLRITGDLLADSGLNLSAESDPPGLSKDEILAKLGQTDVLKTIGSGSGFSQSETERHIRNALISFAIPTLTQGITEQFARNLGLEYLNIDYNAVEGASLGFAKVLGKGLILQGRRQISPTVGNRKVDYDLRLTYRLPSRNVALSRVVFSLGLDQDRPWKLGVQYGFRF